jgi:predicted protein tyrosine phosphatase
MIDLPSTSAPIRPVICGLDELEQHCNADISHVVSILDPGSAEPGIFRLFPTHERLYLRFHDVIDEHEGMVAPQRDDIDRLLRFGRSLVRSRSARGLLIHCHAGLSRSTAAAVLLLAQARPDRSPEAAVTEMLELKPKAWPNLRMIELGDQLLGCEGRLVRAVRRQYADMVERFPLLRHAVGLERHLPDRAENSSRPAEL